MTLSGTEAKIYAELAIANAYGKPQQILSL